MSLPALWLTVWEVILLHQYMKNAEYWWFINIMQSQTGLCAFGCKCFSSVCKRSIWDFYSKQVFLYNNSDRNPLPKCDYASCYSLEVMQRKIVRWRQTLKQHTNKRAVALQKRMQRTDWALPNIKV